MAGHEVTVAMEVVGEPGLKQMLWACAAAPAALGGVVGDEEKLNVHGNGWPCVGRRLK